MSQRTDEVDQAGLTEAAVEAISKAKNEPAWLRQQRLAAFEWHKTIPAPSLRDEEWRRTDIRGLKLDAITPAAGAPRALGAVERLAPAVRDEIGATGQIGGLVVSEDGIAAHQSLIEDLASRGVIFCDLDTAVREHTELVQTYLGTGVPADYSKFSALNAATWTTGVFLYVPRRVELALPLQALGYLGTAGLSPVFRTLVVVEDGADAVLIDQWLGPTHEQSAMALNVQEVFVGRGGRARYVTLQEFGRHVWNFSVNRTLLGRDATASSLVIAVGGRFHKANVESLLQGPGSSSEMLGVLFGDKHQFFDHHTLQDHQAPHTSSDLLYKGALTDQARSVFAGMIHARKTAQKTDAIQTNRNLLLSDGSRADSIPNLEIEANDLRCTHAATITPVDDDQMFYLRARGLTEPDAKRMIVEGFFETVLERIPLPGIVERLRAVISAKIGD